ncbi:MAG: hypothetical protein E6G70_26255 [Alphaproteobacteria bacterium]|nr:MAG: hypothetical protein E6G70_26255 [Alphaproteobacteria bacterium]
MAGIAGFVDLWLDLCRQARRRDLIERALGKARTECATATDKAFSHPRQLAGKAAQRRDDVLL